MSDARVRRARRGFLLRGGILAAALAPLAACLYTPPSQLPSSVRILYSKTTRDSTGTKVDVYFLVAREGNELQLTGESGEDRHPTFASGLRKVLFTRRIDEHDEIWSMDLDGSQEAVVLAAADAECREPAVSPDETRLAFTRVSGGRSEVWVASVDGSDAQPLLSDGGPWSQPAWSPDGRTLAVVQGSGATSRIHLVSAAGGAPRPLAPAGPAGQSAPAWSPDGARLAFALGAGSMAEIAVADVATGSIVRLTENDVEDTSPAWSPSGERIAYVSRRPDARANLWLMDPDGNNREALTRDGDAESLDPDWM
jgi:Tol biopolymer transport system component